MRALVCAIAIVALSIPSGCAALSLFGQTHEHHHVHGDPDVKERLERVEERVRALEHTIGPVLQPE